MADPKVAPTPVFPNEDAAQAAAELILFRGLPRFHQELNSIQSGEPNELRPSAADIVKLREVIGPKEDYRIVQVLTLPGEKEVQYVLSDGTVLIPKPADKPAPKKKK